MAATMADIDGLVRRLEAALKAIEPAPITLIAWRQAILALYTARRPSTRHRMREALGLTIALSAARAQTSSIDAAFVARFASARNGRRASTQNGLLRALRAAITIAGKRNWIDMRQLVGATWSIAEDEAPIRTHHSRESIKRVLDKLAKGKRTWRGHRLFAAASMWAYTGVRKNEALMMRVCDVDFVKRVAWVWPNGRPLKTEHSRQPIPLCQSLIEILQEWIPRANSEWLFPIAGGSRPWTGGGSGRRPTDRLKLAGQKVGVLGFTPQSLRHSLATHLIGHFGWSERQVAQMLRHSGTLTQRHYVHPDVANLAEAIRDVIY